MADSFQVWATLNRFLFFWFLQDTAIKIIRKSSIVVCHIDLNLGL